MICKTRYKVFFAVLLLLVFFVGAGLPWAVTLVLEKGLCRIVAGREGLEGFRVNVGTLGFSGVELNDLTTGDQLSVDMIRLDYSMESLLRKRTDTLLVSGVKLTLPVSSPKAGKAESSHQTVTKDPWTMAGTSLEALLSPLLVTPFLPGNIVIRHALVSVETEKQTIEIPLEAEVSIHGELERVSGDITLLSPGRNIKLSASVDMKNSPGQVSIKTSSFDIKALAALLGQRLPPPLSRAGVRSFSGIVKTGSAEKLVFDMANREALPRVTVSGDALLEGLGGKTPLPVRVDYQCQASPGGKWRVSVKGAGEKKTSEGLFSFFTGEENVAARVTRPRFEVKAAGSRFRGDVEFMASLSNLEVDMDTLHARVRRPRLNGTGSFDFSRKGRGGRVNFTLAASRTTAAFDAGRLEIPKIEIPGRVALTGKLNPSVNIQPQFAGAHAVLPEHGVTIETIEALVPLSFPFQEKTAKGRFSAGRLALNGRTMAGISGGIVQTGTGFDVSGTAAVTGLFQPDQESLMVDFSASAEVPAGKDKGGAGELRFETRKKRIVSNTLDRQLLALGRDMDFNFLFAAEGEIETDINTITSRITLDVSEGFFALPENSLAAGGIDTTLQISSINPLESGNSQVLTIDTIDLDDIHVSDVSLVYAVEPDFSLLLEGCDFRWCRGRVSTGAVRIVPGKENYKLNLYCDRLKLSDILEQIGSFQAEGEGSLSGRIPLSYDRGIVSFDNGFLFSAPGRGGTIRVTGADRLLSGIPRGTAQFSQIDLAREALKNYNYKWARLNFNTSGEELVVKMAFDGKPRDRLPFVYKKELQSFARVDASSPGSRFQGIAIDLNLRLPFNQVLQFGTRLNQILGSQ